MWDQEQTLQKMTHEALQDLLKNVVISFVSDKMAPTFMTNMYITQIKYNKE